MVKKIKINVSLNESDVRPTINRIMSLRVARYSDRLAEITPSLGHKLMFSNEEEIMADLESLIECTEHFLEELNDLGKHIKKLPEPEFVEPPSSDDVGQRTLSDGSIEVGKLGAKGGQLLPDGTWEPLD